MKTVSFGNFPKLDYSAREAVNTLCTNLTFTGDKYRSIMVTSVTAEEGKSFLSIQMMRTLAELGKYVVLLDADLRRSTIDTDYQARYTGGEKLGLAHYLAGKCEIEDILYQTDIDGAYFVPIGIAVSNSLALLNSPRFQTLIRQLSSQADYVLVDAPPIGVIVDASEIAKSCDGAMLAVGYNMVRRRDLEEARQQIELSGCTALGAALNNVPQDAFENRKYAGRSYYNHYGHYGQY